MDNSIIQIIISKSSNFIEITTTTNSLVIKLWQALLVAGISVAVGIGLFVLLGIGLYTMAKNRQMQQKWLAFVPFARYILMGRLIGEIKLFGKKTSKFGLITCLVVLVAQAVTFALTFFEYFPIIALILKDGSATLLPTETGELAVVGAGYAPWALTLITVINYLSLFTDIASILALITIYIELFKRYAPDHYILYAVLSIFIGIEGVFVFIVRNKPAVNYSDYIKEKFIKMQGGFMNMHRQAPDDPFREYARKGEYDPGDPFSEFSDGKPNDNGDDKEE